ncbi:hypothetical protein QUB80_24795 [Chlorogloeopsis sp. ULAP01]|uniref:hypothetical protein n=1 Tax=Chlorogloeopsis sp. ULAP01 TaxID=3056483 RepID=UPI0025AB1B5B|nr:hypothetical protein [Chlorogloeopsis sp. ULAP01]MDM9383903.1 hypothetical protein [Chlorogloeopsis sp. ULAP01]
MDISIYPPGLKTALEFPLVEALFGRRARRFSLGASIPDGPLAFTSRHQPFPLSELEQMMILTAAAGNTGWHHMITRHARYAPHLSNYSAAAGGRTFPSAAGFHTSEIFFTNDDGIYFFPTRDAHAVVERQADEKINLDALLEVHRKRIRKLSESRLYIPPAEPYMEGHNTWCVNRPGSMLIIPVSDIAQHMIANLCFLVQNGYCIYDDVNHEQIPGLEKFKHLVNLDEPFPLTFIEQYSLTESTAELSTCCYAGMLMLQAMGLGGWMFDGMDRHVVLGASGNPEVPGLGFRYDTDERWSLPNPTGLPGVFEAFCPPHYPNLRAAVEAFAKRKFGVGGPFHPDTKGPWKESAKIRASAEIHSEEFKDCVALMAQYIYDRFGKFPGTVPSVFILTYLQAHHLDLEFYDHYFQPGAYLETHAQHMANWHSAEEI